MGKGLIYCLLMVGLYSCDDRSGHLGISESFDDSKARGVFISEYKSLTNPIKINDTLRIHVGKAWLEKKWRYDDDLKSNIIEGCQMILETDKEDLKGFAITWTIGTSFNKSWRLCSDNSIMTDFKEEPTDTIIWEVQRGSFLDSVSKKEIIGKFMLLKNP